MKQEIPLKKSQTSHEETVRLDYILNQIDAVYHRASVKCSLPDSESWIFYFLYDMGGPCNQSEISRRYGISRKTINSALAKLEKKNLVKREAGGGRNVVVSLTEEGLVFAEKFIAPMIEAENSVFDSWPQEEREQILSLAEKYRNELLEQFQKKGLV